MATEPYQPLFVRLLEEALVELSRAVSAELSRPRRPHCPLMLEELEAVAEERWRQRIAGEHQVGRYFVKQYAAKVRRELGLTDA